MNHFFLLFVFLHLFISSVHSQSKLTLTGSNWHGTHTPIKKGTDLYFQGDTLILLDLDGYKPVDQYSFIERHDTLFLSMIEDYSVSCRQEFPGTYRIFWSNNGEKLLLKPLNDPCMERFTRLVAESPWYRKREKEEIRQDWYFLDPEKDGVAGAGIYEAYKFLKFRKSSPITVAVIDCAVDYSHEDLTEIMWRNPNEIPGNNLDDDKNGFKDDVHGWFFSASKSGVPVEYELKEATQIYQMWRNRFDTANPNNLADQELSDYKLFMKAKTGYEKGKKRADHFQTFFSDSVALYNVLSKMLLQSEEPVTPEQVDQWKIADDPLSVSAKEVVKELLINRKSNFDELLRSLKANYNLYKKNFSHLWLYDYNLEWNPRASVGDHPEIPYEKMYGSGTLINPSSANNDHGTHVAGIIGARRGNGKGIEGIADNVRIITLGAIPSFGDERDKDIANCIRYAADMGAKIINMSFAKTLSPHKKTVDEAVRYAEKKGVLFFHAAGNEHINRDSISYYPISQFENGIHSDQWIEVGNSTLELTRNLAASSSNYGKTKVDLFAPGTKIFSATPGNSYYFMTGTSMACPVAAGVAALIWSYFPTLTAKDVKNVLLQSTFKPQDLLVLKPGTQKEVLFESLSTTGGIISAKKAVFAAEKLVKKKKS